MTAPSKNILIMQSGGATNVLNTSLVGVVAEAAGSEVFGRVYGAYRGLEGLLAGQLSDLTGVSPATWERVARTPGAVLGSTRRKLASGEMPAILEMLARHGIGYWFIIGGNDSALTGHMISDGAARAGYDLAVINVPKTIDNDLVMTDHCPGYGSAARFVALATMGSGRDAEAMGQASPITIIEVMGRDAGWLAASAGLAKREERDAPHVICVPEAPVDEAWFVTRIEDAYRRYGFAVAVVSENVRGPDGALGGQSEPWFVDDFGHSYYDGPATYLAALVSRRLGVRARYEKPGTMQRSFIATTSTSDMREAGMAGRAAVRAALEGHRDVMVTLVRGDRPRYTCGTGLAPLEQVAGMVRTLPLEYLDRDGGFVTPEFIRYVKPLVGRIPRFARLGRSAG